MILYTCKYRRPRQISAIQIVAQLDFKPYLASCPELTLWACPVLTCQLQAHLNFKCQVSPIVPSSACAYLRRSTVSNLALGGIPAYLPQLCSLKRQRIHGVVHYLTTFETLSPSSKQVQTNVIQGYLQEET